MTSPLVAEIRATLALAVPDVSTPARDRLRRDLRVIADMIEPEMSAPERRSVGLSAVKAEVVEGFERHACLLDGIAGAIQLCGRTDKNADFMRRSPFLCAR